MDFFDIGVGVVLGAIIIFVVLVLISPSGYAPNDVVAEMVCDSHNMDLVSSDGAKNIVCEKHVQSENRKVFKDLRSDL